MEKSTMMRELNYTKKQKGSNEKIKLPKETEGKQ